MAAVILHHALAYRFIRCFLIEPPYCGIDLEPFGIRIFLMAFIHGLACHLRHIIGVHCEFLRFASGAHGFFFRRLELLAGNIAQFVHAPKHVELARLGAFGIDYRIIAGRCFGQAGKHRRFWKVDLTQRLAKINLCRGSEPVSALPKINLVEVEFKDLILA